MGPSLLKAPPHLAIAMLASFHPGSAFKKRGCQFQQCPSQRIAAVGPLSMQSMPDLLDSKAQQTLMSASTAVNPTSFEFLLTRQLFSRLHLNAVLSGNLIQIPGVL